MTRPGHLPLLSLLLGALVAGPVSWAQATPALRPEDLPALPAVAPEDTPALPADAEDLAQAGQPVTNWIEAQVELHRRGFSCGSIDGVRGTQTANSVMAFQRNEGLRETGELDQATRALLLLTAPAHTTHTFTVADLVRLKPVPATWLGKSQQTELFYATTLELAAERYRANPKYLRALNPDFNWDDVLPGATITVPDVAPFTTPLRAARIHVRLAEKVLEATDEWGRIILHCPVSIAREVEKRPVGELKVVVVIPNPNYTFDPVVFPEVPEAQELGRRLIIPPGPNNPVGLAWIGLDRPGYGIHGTPDPEKVGRTESHGCFRLANWDAVALLAIVKVGTPVVVEP
jgi:lipoprotein-anchoring transpeptidase ErfK/SrfK